MRISFKGKTGQTKQNKTKQAKAYRQQEAKERPYDPKFFALTSCSLQGVEGGMPGGANLPLVNKRLKNIF